VVVRFSEEDKATIWEMRGAGVPVRRIAKHLGRRDSSLRRFIADAGGRRPSEPPRDSWKLQPLRGWSHADEGQAVPREIRERAVRMVLEHQQDYESQWEAICSVAEKLGPTAETVREWVRRAEIDGGVRPGVSSAEAERIRQLER
jgi:transposase-like protein